MNYQDIVWSKARQFYDDPEHVVSASDMHLLHCALGMAGEYAEMLMIGGNEEEEMGDLYFYVALAGKITGWPMTLVVGSQEPSLLEVIGDFVDLVKKKVIYGKDVSDGELQTATLVVMLSANGYCKFVLGLDPKETMMKNAEKIHKRNPNGFTLASQLAKADQNE